MRSPSHASRLVLGLLIVFRFGATQDSDSEDPFPVLEMLQGAFLGDSSKFTSECVPNSAQAAFRENFRSTVETMLQKTRRSMQDGLKSIADVTLELLKACTCGDIEDMAKMQEQANRLNVFATSRGMLNIGSKVSYEPMKALTVAGIDIHRELNDLLVAWKMNKGAAEVGRTLKIFMEEFKVEETENVAPVQHEHVAPSADPYGRETRHYWKVAMNSIFKVFGDSSEPVAEHCFTEEAVKELGNGVETSFEFMLEKTRRSMQAGLKKIADTMINGLAEMQKLCGSLTSTMGVKHLASAAARLKVFATAKTLMNFGVHIEYEALQNLKVGGIDVHKEINQLIGAWRLNQGPDNIGQKIASFFEDFSEEEKAKPEVDAKKEEPLLSLILRDAIRAADKSGHGPNDVDIACFSESVRSDFEHGVNGALDHILKKRKRTMQIGLRELADATDNLLKSMSPECSSSPGAATIWKAARKLQRLTRRMVVDYGTHIKYEAMKSLYVGGIGIHAEINEFIGAWSLGNQRESGRPFGLLMLKLSQITGHDEM